MRFPLQVTFRNMDHSPALEARIGEKVAKLEQLCDEINGCQVVVESEHRSQHKGNLYRVRIDLTLPSRELVVSHQSPLDQAHEDAYVTVRDAFAAMRRQLQRHLELARAS
jgi:Ribosome-associated protein Y (PSrp-1)